MRALLAFFQRPVVVVATVGILALALRLYNLDDPPEHVFDEAYYPKAGCLFVGYSRTECDVKDPNELAFASSYNDVGSWVHPPLGKWAIGLGELAFGPDAFGWRVAAAVFGSLTVVALALIVQLLFRSALWTFVAGLLLATEHLSFVMSRIGMLDIFLAFWVVLGFLFVVLDRRWIDRRTEAALAIASGEGGEGGDLAVRPRIPSPVLRPWRLAAGVAFGGAIATKWSGITAILTAGLVSLLWERTRRREASEHPFWRGLQQEAFGIAASYLVVPAIVYFASYAGYFASFGFDPGEWARLQQAMFTYHRDLETVNDKREPIHPYLSRAWQWILLGRPVNYFIQDTGDVRRQILGIGNPAIFWMSLVAGPYLAAAWRRRRDWIAGFALVAVLGLYLPWFLVSRPQFLFYMTPVTPFLVLAVVPLLRDLSRVRIEPAEGDDATKATRPWLPVVFAFVVVSVGLFIWFWPILTASPISIEAWRWRIWFDGTWSSSFNWI